jgi:hypothetical protein
MQRCMTQNYPAHRARHCKCSAHKCDSCGGRGHPRAPPNFTSLSWGMGVWWGGGCINWSSSIATPLICKGGPYCTTSPSAPPSVREFVQENWPPQVLRPLVWAWAGVVTCPSAPPVGGSCAAGAWPTQVLRPCVCSTVYSVRTRGGTLSHPTPKLKEYKHSTPPAPYRDTPPEY